jgi:anthranilate synthase component 2
MNVKVVLVDFYDSFTFNLSHYFEQLNVDVTVIRHDYLKLDELNTYDAIVLSPGPGLPKEKRNLNELLAQFVGVKPILGVCLGMQALAEHIGGSLVNQSIVKHGVQEMIHVTEHSGLFKRLPSDFRIGLYHSWKVEGLTHLQTASTASGVCMSIEDPKKKIYGVQFHPESILTDHGLELLSNFLKLVQQ